MCLCALDHARADLAQRRARQHRRRIGRTDAGLAQRLCRQIEASETRILVEIAQNVGELECAAKMMRELGLGVPAIAWHTVRDTIAEAGCFLGLLAGTCAKIAFDGKLFRSDIGWREVARAGTA